MSRFEQPEQIAFHLPDWLGDMAAPGDRFGDERERMALVIEASRRNLHQGDGPFAAAVFERDSGRLVALGVNQVLSQGLSVLHGEVVALCLAQRRLDGFDLGAEGLPAHQLVTSTEPCAMCLGAICWSGVRSVLSGAAEADAQAAGFDEGPKPRDWISELQQRGIQVHSGLLRAEAAEVLKQYRHSGGRAYNSRGQG
jgi:tRNA(Arg) A34 adenosine deaminase TadA